jgi:hypothetical protein
MLALAIRRVGRVWAVYALELLTLHLLLRDLHGGQLLAAISALFGFSALAGR